MSFQRSQEIESYVASGDLSAMQYRVVDILGTEGRVGHGLQYLGFGVLLNKPKDKEYASVVVEGTTKLRAGAAMTVGSYFMCSGSGWVTAVAVSVGQVASGTIIDGNRRALGRALTACASGSLFTAQFDPQLVSVVSA